MVKYKKKPIEVDAVQFTGEDIKGLRVVRTEIIYSRDKKLFYVTNCDCRNWLSVEKQDDGKYISYPFAFYSIHSHQDREQATPDHPLVKLYLEIFDLKPEGEIAYLDTPDEETKKVRLSDWIVTDAFGKTSVYSQNDFENLFEKVD